MKTRPANFFTGCVLILSVGVLLPAIWPSGINLVGLLFAIVGIVVETTAIVFAFSRYGAFAAAGAAVAINVIVYLLWMALALVISRPAAKRPAA